MTRRWVPVFFISALIITKAYAISVSELPYEMKLTHRWTNTTGFEIEIDNHKIGAIYRRVIGNGLQYDLYDHNNNLLTSTRIESFPTIPHPRHTRFNVYNEGENIIGSFDEKLFLLNPTFTAYTPDGMKLIQGERNFWNTNINVYDALTDTKIATMSRPLFEEKIKWRITIKHKEPLVERNIDPNLFLTALAMQVDNKYREKQQRPDHEKQQNQINSVYLQKNEAYINYTRGSEATLDDSELDALAMDLERRYTLQEGPISSTDNTEERAGNFVSYCLELANTPGTSASTKKAIFYLLENRLD